MIKAVLFDVGGTLIKPNPSVGDIYADVAQQHGVQADPQSLNQLFSQAWKEEGKKQKSINRDWWRTVVQTIFKPYSFVNFDSFFDDLYKEFEKPERWSIFDDVRPTLDELKKRKLLLAVASNWDDRLPKLLDDLHLSSYFDHQFISFQKDILKPDPRFFQIILESLKLPAENVIHVGDDPVRDQACPEKLGIRPFLIGRPQKGLTMSLFEGLL